MLNTEFLSYPLVNTVNCEIFRVHQVVYISVAIYTREVVTLSDHTCHKVIKKVIKKEELHFVANLTVNYLYW